MIVHTPNRQTVFVFQVAVDWRMWGRALLFVLATAFTVDSEGVQDSYDSQLKVGRSIDIFTRYGYLSLSMKVVPRNDTDPRWIFREPTVDVFSDLDGVSVYPR